MSKALVAAWRRPGVPERSVRSFVETASGRLTPSGFRPVFPLWHYDHTALTYVYNPDPSILLGPRGCRLGITPSAGDELFEAGAPRPPGTFALFRTSARQIEVLTDYVASRSVWFIHRDDLFAAATSQRLLIMLLQSFEANPAAARWMMNTGTLGPGGSWDRRLSLLRPRSRLTLDRRDWTLDLQEGGDLEFTGELHPGTSAGRMFSEVVRRAVEELELSRYPWYLALSGGMDSRLLLHHLRGLPELRAITWTTTEAREDRHSEARIAARVSAAAGVPHDTAILDRRRVPFAEVLASFLAAGEGRIDHLSGYVDGLALWDRMARAGRSCIRGYDAFGRKPPVSTPFQARRASTLLVSSDLRGVRMPSELRLELDDVPAYLWRRRGEELHDWRDRLWLDCRTPVVTAALDDVKLTFVEILNPLLSETIVRFVQRLHWRLRDEKRIVRHLVCEQFPGTPFARRSAVEGVERIVDDVGARAGLLEILGSRETRGLLPDGVRARLLAFLEGPAGTRRFWRTAASLARARAPKPLENAVRRRLRFVWLDPMRLALRGAVVVAMTEMLAEDARAVSARPIAGGPVLASRLTPETFVEGVER